MIDCNNFIYYLFQLLDLSPFISQPPFASAVVLELRKTIKNEYFVQAVLKNNTPEEPITYKVLSMNGKIIFLIKQT
jgi:hypothetical protein